MEMAITEMATRYEAGESLAAIAADAGLGPRAVRWRLASAGVAIRPPGRQRLHPEPEGSPTAPRPWRRPPPRPRQPAVLLTAEQRTILLRAWEAIPTARTGNRATSSSPEGNAFCGHLLDLHDKAGVTWVELAATIGLSKGYVSQLILGRNCPPLPGDDVL